MSEETRILIVDDDPDIRNILNLLLRREFDTAEAANGRDAIAYMQSHRETDLIILDVMMPGMDGIETCEKIREFSNAPILFLTAKSAERDRLAAYQSGGDDFLSKPFSQPELLAKVKSLLRRYQQYGAQRGRDCAADGYGILHPRVPGKESRENRHHTGTVRKRVEREVSSRFGQHHHGACAEPAPQDRGGPLVAQDHPNGLGQGISG